mgnify:CR=1 FL=1
MWYYGKVLMIECILITGNVKKKGESKPDEH